MWSPHGFFNERQVFLPASSRQSILTWHPHGSFNHQLLSSIHTHSGLHCLWLLLYQLFHLVLSQSVSKILSVQKLLLSIFLCLPSVARILHQLLPPAVRCLGVGESP